jgi:Fe-S-cluster-containing dehydrogenase component
MGLIRNNEVFMDTSAEQLHDGRFNLKGESSTKEQEQSVRLYVDLDICSQGECKECVIQCSYFYHPGNNGILSVAELATYYLVCRKCEEPHCVNSCPQDALEQQKDKDNQLIRHNMLCVSCKTCSHACPYGTIYPENVPYIVHNCDFCLDRRDLKDEPLCIKSCPYGALALKADTEELPEKTYLAGDNLIIHSTHWEREKA